MPVDASLKVSIKSQEGRQEDWFALFRSSGFCILFGFIFIDRLVFTKLLLLISLSLWLS